MPKMGVSPLWNRFFRLLVSPPQLTTTYLRCFYLGLHRRMLSSLEHVPGPQIVSMPLKLVLHCKLTDSKQCCIPANLALKDRAFPMTNMVWWTFSSTQPPSRPRRIEPYVEIDPRIQPQYRRTSLPVEILNLKKISSMPSEVGKHGGVEDGRRETFGQPTQDIRKEDVLMMWDNMKQWISIESM